MLNREQRTAVRIGVVIVALMALFPPFFDTGGLFGGARLAFVLAPPPRNVALDIRPTLSVETLLLELSATACFTLAALEAFDGRAPQRARSLFSVGGVIALMLAASSISFSVVNPERGWTEAPFLICLIPIQLPGGFYLFWLRTASIAFLTLVSIVLAGRAAVDKSRRTLILAAGSAVLLDLCYQIARAAGR